MRASHCVTGFRGHFVSDVRTQAEWITVALKGAAGYGCEILALVFRAAQAESNSQ